MSVPSLRSNVFWSFAGSLVLAVSQLAILVVLAKLGSDDRVGAERNGTWTWALSVTGPIFVFGQLKMRQLQTTDARDEHSFAAYAQLRAAMMVAALIAVAAIVAVDYRDATGSVMLAIACTKAFEGGSDVVYGRYQHDEQIRRVALSQIGRGVTSLIVAISVLVATHSVVGCAWVVAVIYLGWMLYDLRAVALPMTPLDTRAVAAVFRQALPLGITSAIGSLQINVPRYFIKRHVSLADQGIFSNMTQLLQFGGMIVTALAFASSARLARAAAADRWDEFTRTLRKLIAIGASLGVAAVVTSLVLGPWVLRTFFSAEFARHADVMVWLAVTSGLVWSYLFWGTALDALRSYRVQPWIHGASTAVIAGAAAILVPRYQMTGAAWAMLVGFSVECGLYMLAVAIPLRKRRQARLLAVAAGQVDDAVAAAEADHGR